MLLAPQRCTDSRSNSNNAMQDNDGSGNLKLQLGSVEEQGD